ncbi:MAG: acetylornithine deacetylase [Halorhodospira sp.]
MATAPPDLQTMIAELVAEPTVSSIDPAWDHGNRGIIERLAEWLRPLGFDCCIVPLPSAPHKANLIATLPAGRASSHGGLALSGHTDTVPFNAARWSGDPFRIREQNGRLYGLGITDMKAFLALAVEAARGLDPKRLRAPLTMLFTADEESGMDGIRALVEAYPEGLGPKYAVIGEPTRNQPVHMHKGMMMEAIHSQGRSGHSSDPTLGRNALDTMARVLDTLIAWRQELTERHRDPRFSIPYPTLNLGYIRGGDSPNRICAEAELHFDLRPLPGMTPSALQRELDQRLQQALGDEAIYLTRRSLFPPHPPMATPRHAELVRVAERLSGATAGAVAFATEAPYLAQLGMETMVLGPGEIEQAHQPDESIAIDRLSPTVTLLRELIHHFCL